ncbi:MAG: DeoR/GlpR family DNA-binding transcription regulator [Spirosomataceae bacterium]
MSFQQRKLKILKLVEEKGEIDVKALAQHIGTSDITIRRDLGMLATEGLLARTHGGAMRLDLLQTPVQFAQKAVKNVAAKEYICRLAAQEIQDGDVIFMDCGSTTFQLCQFIRYKAIKVITNSLPVANALLNTSVSINLIGGELDTERQAVHGKMAVEHILRYQATKAFVGVDGLSVAKGLSAASEKEAEITTAMASRATETYLLCDTSKLEIDKYFQFAPLSIINIMVTDASAAKIYPYQQMGIRIIN